MLGGLVVVDSSRIGEVVRDGGVGGLFVRPPPGRR
jgi:hypothetical protein